MKTKIKKESFVFYKSFYDAISELDEKTKGEILISIIEYGLFGKYITPLNSICKSFMFLIQPQLDANYKRYLNSFKGGAPIGNKNAKKNNQETTERQPKVENKTTKKQPTVENKTTKKQPNVNVNDNVNVNVNVNDNVDVNVNDEHFTPTEFKNLYTTLKLPEYDDVLTNQQEKKLKDVCKKYTKHQIEMFLKNCTYNGKWNFKANLPYILKNIDSMMVEFLQQVEREERARKIREEEEAEKRRKEAEDKKRKPITREEYMRIANDECKKLGITYEEYLNLGRAKIDRMLNK